MSENSALGRERLTASSREGGRKILSGKGKEMLKNRDNVDDDVFEVLEIVGDVAIYATFSGYHNPIMATLDFMLGGDPVMIALHVVKYDDSTVFAMEKQQNKFTEKDGLLHREFFTAGQTAMPAGMERESETYIRFREIQRSINEGDMEYSIAPVELSDLESTLG